MNILIWIFTSFISAIANSFRKKSIDNTTLSNPLFVFIWPIMGLIFIYSLIFLNWINSNIFSESYFIFLLIIWWLFDWFWALIESNIIKKVKISKILPYSNFDKLFVIILWFTLFYWEPWYQSIITLIISIITVVIIMLFSMDFKNIWLDKDIKLYLLVKFLYACTTVIMWYILLEYSTLDIFAVIIFIYLIFHLVVNLFLKSDFKSLFKQNKIFYKYRLLTWILWRLWFILSISIIKSSWVLIASLLSFITIVFSVFSMKFILWDNPTKKQILLAFLVICLIWIWYYFK